MYRSVEVRWFLGGAVDESVATWVNGGTPPPWTGQAPAGREDVYVVLPGSDDMGVKLRGPEVTPRGPQPARFEVKGRVARRGLLDADFGKVRVRGHVEEWLKWSYEGDAIRPFVEGLLAHPARVAVAKARVQRKYDLAPGRVPFPRVGLEADLPRGAYLELAVVRAGETVGWSLGVEAFGPLDDGQLEEAFYRFVGEAFRDCPRSFRLEDSSSYPGWLTTLPR
jgi:hypothetical protein